MAERPERHVEGSLVELCARVANELRVELQREIGLLELALVGVRVGVGIGVGVGIRVRVGVGEVLVELLLADLTVCVDDGAQPRGLRLLGQRIELDRASERHTRREAREADLVR